MSISKRAPVGDATHRAQIQTRQTHVHSPASAEADGAAEKAEIRALKETLRDLRPKFGEFADRTQSPVAIAIQDFEPGPVRTTGRKLFWTEGLPDELEGGDKAAYLTRSQAKHLHFEGHTAQSLRDTAARIERMFKLSEKMGASAPDMSDDFIAALSLPESEEILSRMEKGGSAAAGIGELKALYEANAWDPHKNDGTPHER